LDREIRVGVPARRADGSGRRTAGRWVAPPAVAAVRFSGLRVVGRELSRARLGKAVGVPRGADDPQGPNRPGAGGFARRPPGRGSWGLSLLKFGPSSPGAHAGSATYQGGTRPAASCGCQQARNLPIALDDRAGQLRLLLRDRNAKFTAAFDAVFAAEATKVPITPVRAPRADASDVGHGDDGRQRPAGCLWRRHRRPAGDPDGDPQRPGDLGRLTRPDGLAGADRGRHRV
jgi:hypothetical protein